MRRTKIVCTLGPACDSPEIIENMLLEGMNVARLNCSHGTHEEHKKRIDLVKKIREQHNLPVAILLDTKGPEIRTGIFKNEGEILNKDQEFRFVIEDVEGDSSRCSISYKELYEDVVPGVKILVNDGAIEMEVTEVSNTDIVCKVLNSGKIGSQKGMHISGIPLNLPSITEKDIEDMIFAIENDLDFIAASFIRKASDIAKIREVLNSHNGEDIQIIAKIECQEGLDNIDEIIEIADGIMVARGDLGVDIPPEDVPPAQKRIIRKCADAGKPVITATQMLESMVSSPRPTRAEASDVANAIFDGTSAVMLSGETAAGKYPVESLQMMSRIATTAEENTDYERRFFTRRRTAISPSITNAISYATCATAHDLDAAAIVSITKSGHTARMVAKFKPACPIIGITHSPKMRRQLALSWGVYPYIIGKENNTDSLFSKGTQKALETGIIKHGDTIILTAGVPTWISGTTNIMKVAIAGEGQE
ncbi:MAG: pyruvate kinase [Ignavibacteriales bacterium]